jgi:hypothetical protein
MGGAAPWIGRRALAGRVSGPAPIPGRISGPRIPRYFMISLSVHDRPNAVAVPRGAATIGFLG